jgi:hypothetical protein
VKVIELDHWAYLIDRPYRRRVHIELRRLRRGSVSELVVLHEADGACCQRQAWALTLRHLVAELEADGGLVT